MKICPRFPRLVFALAIAGWPAGAQDRAALDAINQRLERLEQQNAQLLDEIRLLRQQLQDRQAQNTQANSPSAGTEAGSSSLDQRLQALQDKVDVTAGRVAEQNEVKIESAERSPVRLTGMALFNLFSNTRHGGPYQDPVAALPNAAPVNSGATLRQTTIGLDFRSPEAILGGQFSGQVMLDLWGGSADVLENTVRLRTAYIEGDWSSTGILVGQEKPIFSPREPNSLAQVGISPLSAAGNLWRWRPQIRLEKRLALGSSDDLTAQFGVSQTYEEGAVLPARFASTLEAVRPALEGRFQLRHRFDSERRLEIAPGFHFSTTHVGGFSVPSHAASLDWFVNPVRRVEFTGALFIGQNLANLGGGGVGQGFTFLALPSGELRAIPVRTRGGWMQVTFVVTPRLSFNLYGGEDNPNDRDLAPDGISRNLAYAGNAFYRLAHNVVLGAEISQVRTSFLAGQRPLNNHYDLALAYLF